MIIACPSCEKKFEIDSALIPPEGRNLKCGSCGKEWFYSNNLGETTIIKPSFINNENIDKPTKIVESNENQFEKNDKDLFDINTSNKKFTEKKIKSKKSTNFTLGKIFSYFFVIIITVIGLIIFLDTFKIPLSNYFPGLELLLYNLYETLKDMTLFIKDLSV